MVSKTSVQPANCSNSIDCLKTDLYINGDGEVACIRHRGGKAGWVKVTKEELAGFTGLFGCEYCAEETK